MSSMFPIILMKLIIFIFKIPTSPSDVSMYQPFQ